MKFTALIDAIVRQTTVLIAELATAAGVRAPLAHLADQVFHDLVRQLEAQGLGRKVVADMFGMALRTYQRKVQRISESLTDRNRTLWEATLQFVEEEGTVNRARVLSRFRFDNDEVVRAVLHDLVESGLVYRTGRGPSTIYRAAEPEEVSDAGARGAESTAAFVWLMVYRAGGPVGLPRLLEETGLDAPEVLAALERLVADHRISEEVDPGGAARWRCSSFLLPPEADAGWEAALFHHYQAVVTAIAGKLHSGSLRGQPQQDRIGGSTYDFLIWEGHPLEEEVLGLLREVRERASKLRRALTAYNEQTGRPEDPTRVTFYVGQGIISGEEE